MRDQHQALKAYLAKERARAPTPWRTFVKRAGIVGGIVGALGLATVSWLSYDYMQKREQLPIRDALYQVQETMTIAGGDRYHDSKLADRTMEARYELGGDENTKFGSLLGSVKVTRTDRIMQYMSLDQNNNTLAFSTEKREVMQQGLQTSGSMDFREQEGNVTGVPGRFITYSLYPERGLRNVQLNLLEDEHDQLTLINELVTNRHWLVGWSSGDLYREGAEINEFPPSAKNRVLEQELFSVIREYHQPVSQNDEKLEVQKRDRIIARLLRIEGDLDKEPVIVTHEDGILGWWAHGADTYLFSNPSWKERFFAREIPSTGTSHVPLQDWTVLHTMPVQNPRHDIVKLRVNRHWDLWPGNYWLLNKLHFGEAPNMVYPFRHENLGGYTIEDGKGLVARVYIEDFAWHYGNDLVFHYYVDKNGDGKIDESESVGRVIYGTSHDEHPNLDNVIGLGKDKRDVTQNHLYTFLPGARLDKQGKMEDFYLCNTIESFMIDPINRGYGLHSVLGFINQHRSDLILRSAMTLPSLGRALTPESTIVAEQDIMNLLHAAHREYADKYVALPK